MIVKTATLPKEEDDALAEKKEEERSKQASISMTYLEESVEHKPPEENASVPLQVDTHAPLIPVSNHLSTEISAKDKFAAKAQSNSQHGDSVVKTKNESHRGFERRRARRRREKLTSTRQTKYP